LRLKVVLLGLALLLCGVVIGAGGMLFWGRELILKRLQYVRPGPELICRNLESSLNLTPDQTLAVGKILNDYFPRIRALRQNKDDLTREEFRAMHQEILAVLTPGQAEHYEEEFGKMLPRPWRRHGFHHSERTGPPLPGGMGPCQK
jgi:hypothetical protein